jgi:hypothetical protein
MLVAATDTVGATAARACSTVESERQQTMPPTAAAVNLLVNWNDMTLLLFK